MWLRDEIVDLSNEVCSLQRALVGLAEKNREVIIPGYTHLQRAQPVYLAHHLLAYVEMFDRDAERLSDCFHRTNVCPLGSGAIAGSDVAVGSGDGGAVAGVRGCKRQTAVDAKFHGRNQRSGFCD